MIADENGNFNIFTILYKKYVAIIITSDIIRKYMDFLYGFGRFP